MENSSKALLIIGAVLVAILIITIGVYVYHSASATVKTSMTETEAQEITTWNNQLFIYQGDDKTGTEVRGLLNKIISNSEKSANIPERHPNIFFAYKDGQLKGDEACKYDIKKEDAENIYLNGINKFYNQVVTSHIYTIEFEYGSSGFIEDIVIWDVNLFGEKKD